MVYRIAALLAGLLTFANYAVAAPKRLAAVFPPAGETSQLSADEGREIKEAIESDLKDALAGLGFTVVTDENVKQVYKNRKIDPEKAEQANSIRDLARTLKLNLFVLCVASSHGEKHSIALRVLSTETEAVLAATDINGKNVGGLKRSWAMKQTEFLGKVKSALDGSAEASASSDAGDDADEAARKAMAKQDSKDLKKLCDAGEGAACSLRGYLYERGDGVRKNRGIARDHYRKGCDASDALGCLLLARMYVAGDGVEKDTAKAKELVQKACKLGSEPACSMTKSDATATAN